MDNSSSQAYQDFFVFKLNNSKKNGTFLEIGANHPITTNNTYSLEAYHDWRGIMVEYDTKFGPLYKTHRPKSMYILQDATKVDYLKHMQSFNMPSNIDYLQIDLDVNNESTIKTLRLFDKAIFDKYKFATVTFEHDIYSGDFFNTRKESREIFKKHGYVLLFPDVKVMWNKTYQPFEDWYVHPDLVDNTFISKLKTDLSLTCDEIKELLRII